MLAVDAMLLTLAKVVVVITVMMFGFVIHIIPGVLRAGGESGGPGRTRVKSRVVPRAPALAGRNFPERVIRITPHTFAAQDAMFY